MVFAKRRRFGIDSRKGLSMRFCAICRRVIERICAINCSHCADNVKISADFNGSFTKRKSTKHYFCRRIF